MPIFSDKTITILYGLFTLLLFSGSVYFQLLYRGFYE